uniref:Uncharacterized protein n=1 Tax=Pristionchus pacificus TaxID=54126 RepID=A0A2A6CBI0_PRIPA|eukprot:PDM75466.1 hypothetical protein PRIPAC_42643 [Pristionchus pacificus]
MIGVCKNEWEQKGRRRRWESHGRKEEQRGGNHESLREMDTTIGGGLSKRSYVSGRVQLAWRFERRKGYRQDYTGICARKATKLREKKCVQPEWRAGEGDKTEKELVFNCGQDLHNFENQRSKINKPSPIPSVLSWMMYSTLAPASVENSEGIVESTDRLKLRS